MKKLILLALTALVMVGCDEAGRISQDGVVPVAYKKDIYEYWIVIIDSCEYINYYQGLAHKGNCKYCAERRKQELKELVEQLKKGE